MSWPAGTGPGLYKQIVLHQWKDLVSPVCGIFLGQRGGASRWWRVCYQRGLPRLLFCPGRHFLNNCPYCNSVLLLLSKLLLPNVNCYSRTIEKVTFFCKKVPQRTYRQIDRNTDRQMSCTWAAHVRKKKHLALRWNISLFFSLSIWDFSYSPISDKIDVLNLLFLAVFCCRLWLCRELLMVST